MSKKSIAIAHRMSSKMCILTKKMTSLSRAKVLSVYDLCWFHNVKAIDVYDVKSIKYIVAIQASSFKKKKEAS